MLKQYVLITDERSPFYGRIGYLNSIALAKSYYYRIIIERESTDKFFGKYIIVPMVIDQCTILKNSKLLTLVNYGR